MARLPFLGSLLDGFAFFGPVVGPLQCRSRGNERGPFDDISGRALI